MAEWNDAFIMYIGVILLLLAIAGYFVPSFSLVLIGLFGIILILLPLWRNESMLRKKS